MEVIGGSRRCWGGHNNIVSPIDSFASVRFEAGRSVFRRERGGRGGPSSGWFHPRSAEEDSAGYETIATHSSVSLDVGLED